MNENAVILTKAERVRVATNLRPKDAATVLIIDRSSKTPRVLMGKRHASHKFMPGKFVFPGGRVDPGDRRMVATGALSQVCEDRLMKRAVRPSSQKARVRNPSAKVSPGSSAAGAAAGPSAGASIFGPRSSRKKKKTTGSVTTSHDRPTPTKPIRQP